VAQLGLSQTVLNHSLALMGLPFVVDKTKLYPGSRIPRALRNCRPDKILGMAELLGVIVTACKYVSQWDQHWYEKAVYRDIITGSSTSNLNDDAADPNSALSGGTDFVPWNPAESSQLYGACSEAHLELFEKKIMKVDDALLFTGADDSGAKYDPHASKLESMVQGDGEETQTTPDIPSSSSLASETQVVHPASIYLRLHPSCRPKPYISRTRGAWFEEMQEGMHGQIPSPPFGSLIEYVSSKTGANPMNVFKFHMMLGEEMERRNIHHDQKLEQKRKRRRLKELETA
jgi:hypothetical protein